MGDWKDSIGLVKGVEVKEVTVETVRVVNRLNRMILSDFRWRLVELGTFHDDEGNGKYGDLYDSSKLVRGDEVPLNGISDFYIYAGDSEDDSELKDNLIIEWKDGRPVAYCMTGYRPDQMKPIPDSLLPKAWRAGS